MKYALIWLIPVFLLAACRPPVASVSRYDEAFSLQGVNSYALILHCDEADITELDDAYVEKYCQFLQNQLTAAIEKQYPEWQRVANLRFADRADLYIDARLEQLYGGNQFLRFLPTFEAGRTMLTVNFDFYRNKRFMAQRRLTEITRRIHFEDEKYTNEEAIDEDSKIMATYLVQFMSNPKAFDRQYKAVWGNYNPH